MDIELATEIDRIKRREEELKKASKRNLWVGIAGLIVAIVAILIGIFN